MLIRWAAGIGRQIVRAATSGTKNPKKWLIDWVRGHQSDSGIDVNADSTLRYAPVWYAVNKIAGHISQMPLVTYRRLDERTKERAIRHPAYRLLKHTPNRMMSPSVFKELLQYHALIWGNGRALIDRNTRGNPVELIPLLPDRTETVIVDDQKWHITRPDDSWEPRRIRDADVLHIAGLGFDGVCGYPLWDLAKNSTGLGLATEKHGNRFFRNDATPGVILEVPEGKLRDEDEARKFLNQFRSMHEGSDHAFKAALLREGIKANKLAMTGEESQWIDQRKFQRQEVALWFLLESILGDDESSSYNSQEQKNLAYLVNCLNRWLVKWQEECEGKLLSRFERESETHFVRFSTGALLRSDTQTTYETLALGVRGMLLTPNEARERLDLNPIAGGDQLLNPAITQLMPAEDDDPTDES